MKWYEKIFNVRINITIFRFRFGSELQYRNYLNELWYSDLSDITNTDSESDTYADIFFPKIYYSHYSILILTTTKN